MHKTVAIAVAALTLTGCASLDNAKQVRRNLVVDTVADTVATKAFLAPELQRLREYDRQGEARKLAQRLAEDCEACKSSPNPADCLVQAGVNYQLNATMSAGRISNQQAAHDNALSHVSAHGEATRAVSDMADAEHTATVQQAVKDYFKSPEGQAALESAATMAQGLFQRPTVGGTRPANPPPAESETHVGEQKAKKGGDK